MATGIVDPQNPIAYTHVGTASTRSAVIDADVEVAKLGRLQPERRRASRRSKQMRRVAPRDRRGEASAPPGVVDRIVRDDV